MITLNGVSLRYQTEQGSIDILRQVDLAVAAGERVAIAGPSGSGKTSLLLLLAGLEAPTAGWVEFNGRRLDQLSRDALADMRRDQIGIVFQSFHLIPSLNALDNAALPLEIAGASDARSRARTLLGKVGLGHRLAHYPRQLSGGEQQRVAIVRALAHRPKVLLADEPTGNLDAQTGAEVASLLLEPDALAGTTLVLVTHDMTLAGRCDRVLTLSAGQVQETVVNHV